MQINRVVRRAYMIFMAGFLVGDCPDFRGARDAAVRTCLTAAKMGPSPLRPWLASFTENHQRGDAAMIVDR